MRTSLLFLLALTGCPAFGPTTDMDPVDEDGDGFLSDDDCDDGDPRTFPGNTEICDGEDNNCDGVVDEGLTTTFFIDADADGVGSDAETIEACEVPEGFALSAGDCDDDDVTRTPGAPEICDGIDNDCDGAVPIDEADDDVDGYRVCEGDCDDLVSTVSPGSPETCDGLDNDCDAEVDEGVGALFADVDGDGFGDPAVMEVGCDSRTGFVDNALDCNDVDPLVFTGAPEQCDGLDNDCDGVIPSNELDGDADGFLACQDCDDTSAARFPGNPESCDGLDNDCNTLVDEGVTTYSYADLDDDGFGAGSPLAGCDLPVGRVDNDGDCDDAESLRFPGNAEVCDGLDNDCDGRVPADELDGDGDGVSTCAGDCDDLEVRRTPGASETCDGLDNDCNDAIDDGVLSSFYADADSDGYGDPTVSEQACVAPAGFVADLTDCDDADDQSFPGGTEVCDLADNDCNGLVDDSDVLGTYYADADMDGFGDPDDSVQACGAPPGFVADDTDCDDADNTAFPGNPEVCDGIDNNCDSSTDEGVELTFYADTDTDGFGDVAVTVLACDVPAGFVTDDTDCDDADGTSFPGGTEVCDGADNNCDSVTDEGVQLTFYADTDTDGFGDVAVTVLACDAPTGFVTDDTDCDDADGTAFPGNPEVCDGVDNNCDSVTDEGVELTFYADTDTDGFGDPAVPEMACEVPEGFVLDDTDCDDADDTAFPGNPEVCDTVDNNCDTVTDEGVQLTFYLDEDGDTFGDSAVSELACDAPEGFVADDTDCNDKESLSFPSNPEVCDGLDNNCDLVTDEGVQLTFYLDEDGDTFGDSAVSELACDAPEGFVADDTDCDDKESLSFPGNPEACGDGVDNNCDTFVDEDCATEHCGPITDSETWALGEEHRITCDVFVEGTSSPVLTIEDGVDVFVDGDFGIYVGQNAPGALNVNAFTSGVTMMSGQPVPAPGDHAGITLGLQDAGSIIDGLVVQDADIGLSVASSFSGLSNSTFVGNSLYGLELKDGSVPGSMGELHFADNGAPILTRWDNVEMLAFVATYLNTEPIHVRGGVMDVDTNWFDFGVPLRLVTDLEVEAILDLQPMTIEVEGELAVGKGTTTGRLYTSAEVGTVHLVASPTSIGSWSLHLGVGASGSVLSNLHVDEHGSFEINSDVGLTSCRIENGASHGVALGAGFTFISDCEIVDNAADGVNISTFGGLGFPFVGGDQTRVAQVRIRSFSNNTVSGNGGAALRMPANSAGELASDSTYLGNAEPVVLNSNRIEQSDSWSGLDVRYRLDESLVVEGTSDPTLTLHEGVVLSAADSAVEVRVGSGSNSGRLVVNGSSASRVLFTSENPVPGGWRGLYVDGVNQEDRRVNLYATGLDVEFGGSTSGSPRGNITTRRTEIDLDDVHLTNGLTTGLRSVIGSGFWLRDSTITDNAEHGVYMDDNSEIFGFTGNTVTGNGVPFRGLANEVGMIDASNTMTGNMLDEFQLRHGISKSARWVNHGVAYRHTIDASVHSSSEAALTTLELDPGVTVLFDAGVRYQVGIGSLPVVMRALGSASEPIVFTATDGASFWGGISLFSACDSESTEFDHVDVSFGGSDPTSRGNMNFEGCEPRVSNSVLHDSRALGYYRSSPSFFLDESNAFFNNPECLTNFFCEG